MTDQPPPIESEPLPILIRDAFDTLAEGVAVFDARLQLIYCNRPFHTLRNYPDSICRQGAHISELYTFNAKRGDYGEVDIKAEVARRVERARGRTLEELDQHLPDGTILHVRYAPVANDALLFTYEDVTVTRHTEVALRASEQRNLLVAETTTEGIYEWRPLSNEFIASQRLDELLGFETGEIKTQAKNWNDRIHPQDFDDYRRSLTASLKDDRVRHECEYRIRDQSGDYMWILDRGVVAERDQAGHAVRFIGAILSIEDRKHAEEALKESEQRHALAVEALNEGIYDWDLAADSIYYSGNVRKILGLTAAELASPSDWIDHIHPEDRQDYHDRLVEHFKGRSDHFEWEGRYRRNDEQWYWARTHGIALRDESGRATRMIGSTGDITEQKAMTAELEALRARLLDAVESIASGFALFDTEDRLVLCNSVYQRYFAEVSNQVVSGTRFMDFIRAAVEQGLFPDAAGHEAEFIESVHRRRGMTEGYREQHMRGDQWLQISDHRISDGGLVSIYTDITDLKHREQELRTARDAAEQALEDLRIAQRSLVQAEKMASLGQLTAGIAHEIKNPLHFINNFSKTSIELLHELAELLTPQLTALDATAREDADDLFSTLEDDLNTIREHGERADGIVRGMLLHSRGDTGQRQVTDLNALIEECLNLAYHGQRASVPDFNVNLERDLDSRVGCIDLVSQEISRVFVNLLGNAFYAVHKRQAAQTGDYRPTVSVSSRLLSEDRAEIRLRDNGTGIAPDILEQLFTPFFTTKPAGEGTGLGLSISRDIIVEQHGGNIRAESEEGTYTEFIIELPRLTHAPRTT